MSHHRGAAADRLGHRCGAAHRGRLGDDLGHHLGRHSRPVVPIIGIDPVLIALAAGAGSLFCVHVTCNTFWLLQSLLGQTTRGALKTGTVGVSVASVVAILLILPLSVLI